MSVTAAQGFVASGVAAGIRPSGKPDVAVVRSRPACRRCRALDDQPRAGGARHRLEAPSRARAAPGRADQRGLRERRNGARGEDDAVASAAALAGELGLAPEEVLVLSTGVIGVPLPLEKVLAGARAAAAALSADGGDAAAGAILTTDSGPKVAVATARRVHGRRDGEGRRDDPSAPRDDARRDHDRLPARRRVSPRRSCGPPSRAASTGSRSTAIARRTTRSCCSRTGPAAPPATTRRSPRRSDEVCADLARQVVADGEGATVVLEIGVSGAATTDEAEAIARRIATSPLVKTAAFGHDPNWGACSMAAGSAPYNGGYAQLDTERLTVAFDGVAVFADGRADRRRARALGRRSAGSTSTLGLGDGAAGVPRLRPHLRLRPDQRGVHDVSRIVLKLGGRVAAEAAAEALALREAGTTSSSCTAPGRRSRPRWSAAGSCRRSSTDAA